MLYEASTLVNLLAILLLDLNIGCQELFLDLMRILSKPHIFLPRSWNFCNSSIKNGSGSEEAGRGNEKFVQMQL